MPVYESARPYSARAISRRRTITLAAISACIGLLAPHSAKGQNYDIEYLPDYNATLNTFPYGSPQVNESGVVAVPWQQGSSFVSLRYLTSTSTPDAISGFGGGYVDDAGNFYVGQVATGQVGNNAPKKYNPALSSFVQMPSVYPGAAAPGLTYQPRVTGSGRWITKNTTLGLIAVDSNLTLTPLSNGTVAGGTPVISDSGVVAAYGNSNVLYRWDSLGQATPTQMNTGASQLQLLGVNDSGTIVGTMQGVGTRWVRTSTIGSQLPRLPGISTSSQLQDYPTAIDNAGNIVGSTPNSVGDNTPVIWTSNNGVKTLASLLPTIPGSILLSSPTDISDSGYIVGTAYQTVGNSYKHLVYRMKPRTFSYSGTGNVNFSSAFGATAPIATNPINLASPGSTTVGLSASVSAAAVNVTSGNVTLGLNANTLTLGNALAVSGNSALTVNSGTVYVGTDASLATGSSLQLNPGSVIDSKSFTVASGASVGGGDAASSAVKVVADTATLNGDFGADNSELDTNAMTVGSAATIGGITGSNPADTFIAGRTINSYDANGTPSLTNSGGGKNPPQLFHWLKKAVKAVFAPSKRGRGTLIYPSTGILEIKGGTSGAMTGSIVPAPSQPAPVIVIHTGGRGRGSMFFNYIYLAAGPLPEGVTSLVDPATPAIIMQVEDGGILSPGNGPGTIAVDGNLQLSNNSILQYELSTSGVVGNDVNDWVSITNTDNLASGGNLILDGKLQVEAEPGFRPGKFRLFSYAGTLTNNGVIFDGMPVGYNYTIDTATAGQVNLLVAMKLPGDADRNGTVTAADFTALASHFNQSGTTIATGDFNGDGFTNLLDFNALATNFGLSGSAVALGSTTLGTMVPEPAGLSGLLLAAGVLGRCVAKRR